MQHYFYGIHIRALIVKIQENTNKYTTLKYNFFTIKALMVKKTLYYNIVNFLVFS
jgi:hypothetical protein